MKPEDRCAFDGGKWDKADGCDKDPKKGFISKKSKMKMMASGVQPGSLAKRTGKFGERMCERDDERVWDTRKDACITDKQFENDYGKEALECLNKFKWYSSDEKKCFNAEEKCAREKGKWEKDEKSGEYSCQKPDKERDDWFKKPKVKVDEKDKKDVSDKKSASPELLNLATTTSSDKQQNASLYAGFGCLAGFAAGVLTVTAWSRRQKYQS